MSANKYKIPNVPRPLHPFRRAVLRGLGVVLPPLLTIVILVWAARTVGQYVLGPINTGAEKALVGIIADIHPQLPGAHSTDDPTVVTLDGVLYKQLDTGQFIPASVYRHVQGRHDAGPLPVSAEAIYSRYVHDRYLQPYFVVPLFVCLFLGLMYLIGHFLAAGLGHMLWRPTERLIARLPLVRSVYSSVKQVTDFMLSERNMEFKRVVAIEYPRKGIWTLAFVTGEGMQQIAGEAQERVASILVPTSPLPMTGYTMMVRKSELVEVNLTIDQALQFIISCGVVVPPQQVSQLLTPAA